METTRMYAVEFLNVRSEDADNSYITKKANLPVDNTEFKSGNDAICIPKINGVTSELILSEKELETYASFGNGYKSIKYVGCKPEPMTERCAEDLCLGHNQEITNSFINDSFNSQRFIEAIADINETIGSMSDSAVIRYIEIKSKLKVAEYTKELREAVLIYMAADRYPDMFIVICSYVGITIDMILSLAFFNGVANFGYDIPLDMLRRLHGVDK